MSASLVGSEMCIRDRRESPGCRVSCARPSPQRNVQHHDHHDPASEGPSHTLRGREPTCTWFRLGPRRAGLGMTGRRSLSCRRFGR
eukprot:6142647-Alexandrium_andersonii.AAC.1